MKQVIYNDTMLWATLEDWPIVPDHLLHDLSLFNNNELQYEGKGLRVGLQNNKHYKNSLYKRWPALPNLESWIKSNIPCNFNQIGIQEINPVIKNTKLLVHCDKEPRRYTILYILDLGGENVFTNFYQEQNQPLVRNYGDVTNNLDNLQHIASAKFKTHQWVLLNGLIMHDLDPLERPRIAITGSIWDLKDINSLYHIK